MCELICGISFSKHGLSTKGRLSGDEGPSSSNDEFS